MCDKKNIKLEFSQKQNAKITEEILSITNPIANQTKTFSEMVKKILDSEIPMLKNNSLIHDLVLYNLMEKVKTVQTVENVLSYIKGKNVKEIQDVHFKNGEVYIKCSI